MLSRRFLLSSAGSAFTVAPALAICALPRAVQPTPQERIEAGLADIMAAMVEMHPDTHVSRSVHLFERHGSIAIGSNRFGYPVAGALFDDGPLLAADRLDPVRCRP